MRSRFSGRAGRVPVPSVPAPCLDITGQHHDPEKAEAEWQSVSAAVDDADDDRG